MVYLDSSIITVPNLLGIESSSYRLVLKNNVTNEVFTLDASNLSDNQLYYQFGLDVSSLSQNEYTMDLYNDSSQYLGRYLAQKGINTVQNSSFNNDTEYVVFEG